MSMSMSFLLIHDSLRRLHIVACECQSAIPLSANDDPQAGIRDALSDSRCHEAEIRLISERNADLESRWL